MENKIIRKNKFLILLLGILGVCYALLDWDANISDLFYLKYNDKVLISIITAGIGFARFIATIFCIKITGSKNPNRVFNKLISCCIVLTLLSCFLYQYGFAIIFTIVYLMLQIFLEILSGYHFPYVSSSLPDEQVVQVHSKRVALFKLLNAAGITLSAFICASYYNQAFLIISVICTVIFLISIMIIINIVNINVKNDSEKVTLLEKLDISKYSSNFKVWTIVRIIGKFSTSSLVVILSLRAIDSNVNISILKTCKSILWIISSIGFFSAGFFIKRKLIIDVDIIIKLLIVILLPLTLYNNIFILILILMYGILEPFNSISHLEMLKKDKDGIDLAQKDLLISLFSYLAKFLSGIILVNINFTIAILIIFVLLLISVIIEYSLYKKYKVKD